MDKRRCKLTDRQIVNRYYSLIFHEALKSWLQSILPALSSSMSLSSNNPIKVLKLLYQKRKIESVPFSKFILILILMKIILLYIAFIPTDGSLHLLSKNLVLYKPQTTLVDTKFGRKLETENIHTCNQLNFSVLT